jgi:protein-S-isoprenylcysteine O-methyltransferase Ste14
MAGAAIVIFVVYFLLATVRPLVASYRRTGDVGFRVTPGAGRVIGALFPTAYFLVALGAVTDLTGSVDRIDLHDGILGPVLGFALAATGLLLIVSAQDTMGVSWRIGVDPDERTDLITDGPFRWMRNPIYTAMVLMALGVTLLVPNVFSVAGLALFLVTVELQVRVVEEPHLSALHGEPYRRWAARTGRFVPRVGVMP